MLKGIPKILSPELLRVICEMGHGDRIMIGDGNFPIASMGKNSVIIRCDGHSVTDLLDAVLTLMPLDRSAEKSVYLMAVPDGANADTSIWKTIGNIISAHDDRGEKTIDFYERFEFYDETKKCYALVSTGEQALYANVMLQKGVIAD